MQPKPLKDKLLEDDCYWHEDVKDAVDWLVLEFRKHGFSSSQFFDVIKTAFPDIFKEVEQKCQK